MTPTTPATPEFIKPRQIEQEKGIAYSTVRDAVSRGDLPAVRLGRAIYIKRTDVERWLASRLGHAAA